MSPTKVLLLNLPSFSERKYCREIMGGFGLEVGDSLRYPPLPLAWSAAILERGGVPVELLDAEALELEAEEILARVESGGFGLVGVISSLITLQSDLAFVDRMKQRVAGLKVFLTGPVIHLYTNEILGGSSCDFTIDTLSDDQPLELVRALENGTVAELSGISWRRDDGEVVRNPDDGRMIDMRDLPLPARHFLPNERYFIAGMKGPMTTVQTGRGCPYHCDICAYEYSQGHVWRVRPIDDVMEELEEIVHRHGVKNIVFRDITFTVKRERTMELCRRLIDAKLGVTWWAETTLNLVDEELLRTMQEAGMDALSLGVETGGAAQQEEHWAQKLLGFEETRAVFATCRRLGIKTRAYFVVGVPGDTPASLKETIRWARALRPTTLQFLPYRALPAKLEEYTVVDEEVLGSIKRAYLAYYLTPANLLGQLLQPRLFTNRIKRFFSLRRA